METNLLKEAGLTDGETKVYLALLELGISTTGPITRKAHVAKSIVYSLLQKLMEKGLVSFIIKEKTKHFQASDPHKIIEFIDEKKKKIEQNKIDIQAILPDLLAKTTSSKKSEATIYYGYKGIRTAYEHVYQKMSNSETIHSMGIPPAQPEEQHLYWKKDHVKRVQTGFKMKLLFNQDTDSKILKDRNAYTDSESRYMPPGIKTPSAFVIFADTVQIILQSPNALCVEIINQDIADSFKAYFEDYWKRSKPFNPK